jgi:hypothetical protein
VEEVTGGPIQPVDVWGVGGCPLSSQLISDLAQSADVLYKPCSAAGPWGDHGLLFSQLMYIIYGPCTAAGPRGGNGRPPV